MSSSDLMKRIKAAGAVNAEVNKGLAANGVTTEAVSESEKKVGTENQPTGPAEPGHEGIDPQKRAEPLAPPVPGQGEPLGVQQRAADPAQDAFQNGTLVAAGKGIDGQPLEDMNPDPDFAANIAALAPQGPHSIVGVAEDNGQTTGMASSYQPVFVRAGYGQSEYFNPTEEDLAGVKKGEFLAGTMQRWVAPNGEIIKPIGGVFLPVASENGDWDEHDMVKDLRHIAKRNDGSLFEGTGE